MGPLKRAAASSPRHLDERSGATHSPTVGLHRFISIGATAGALPAVRHTPPTSAISHDERIAGHAPANPPPSAEPSAVEMPVAMAVFDDGTSLSLIGATVMGREPQRDRRVIAGDARAVIITDARNQISRIHLLLRVQDWVVEVCDLGSRNGTWIREASGDWRRILPGLAHNVSDGQTIRLGTRGFRLRYVQRTPLRGASLT